MDQHLVELLERKVEVERESVEASQRVLDYLKRRLREKTGEEVETEEDEQSEPRRKRARQPTRNASKTCYLCTGRHRAAACFIYPEGQKRLQVMAERGLCARCTLPATHKKCGCAKKRCGTCGAPHVATLCPVKYPSKNDTHDSSGQDVQDSPEPLEADITLKSEPID